MQLERIEVSLSYQQKQTELESEEVQVAPFQTDLVWFLSPERLTDSFQTSSNGQYASSRLKFDQT